MMPKRTFTKDYKLEVIELARTSGKSKAQLERELGLTPGQIGNWEKALQQPREQALQQPREQAFPGTGHQMETWPAPRNWSTQNVSLSDTPVNTAWPATSEGVR